MYNQSITGDVAMSITGAAEITYMMSLIGRCEGITDLYDAFDIAIDIIATHLANDYYSFVREFRKRMEEHEN